MEAKKKLTDAEREAITAKYQQRIIELGTPIFGPPDDEPPDILPFPGPDPKAQEFQRRILDATIELLEAAPPPDLEPAPHRKPGDLDRTASRLLAGEVDLPEGFDRQEAAALFQRQAHFERAKIAFGQQMDAVASEALAGFLPMLEAVTKFAIDVYHLIKQWAQEDPEGPGGELYRDLNRAWRKGAGRSRGRSSDHSRKRTSRKRQR